MTLIADTWFIAAITSMLFGAFFAGQKLAVPTIVHWLVKEDHKPISMNLQKLRSHFLALLVSCIEYLGRRSSIHHQEPIDVAEISNSERVHYLKHSDFQHEAALSLINLFDQDGAGAWPPKVNHDNWPLALRPYKDIYLELVPLLPKGEPSLDDEMNNLLRANYRTLFRRFLAGRVDIARVQTIMAAVESGNWDLFPREAYNGFYCCIAVCRHAYRWATIPVVKVAQEEKIIDLPPELEAPWPYLQRTFGVTADSGNNTANVLHNFNEKGERVYKINVGMSDLIQSSEDVFFRMFFDLEVLAFPIYHEMVCAIMAFEQQNQSLCAKHLDNINQRLRRLLLIFFDGLTDSRVSRSVWLSYIQGFQGWGVGKMVDGEFIKYDGLSGNHVLFFQALDAFLGMERYLTDENMNRYIPVNQRNLCLSLKKHSFRLRVKNEGNSYLEEKVGSIVKQLKLFRAAHRTRVMPYLKTPAPERLTMTAGKSVLEGATAEETIEAMKSLDLLMATRFKETI